MIFSPLTIPVWMVLFWWAFISDYMQRSSCIEIHSQPTMVELWEGCLCLIDLPSTQMHCLTLMYTYMYIVILDLILQFFRWMNYFSWLESIILKRLINTTRILNIIYYIYSLKGLNGEMLSELCILSSSHPDTFYSVISKTAGIDVVGIMRLGNAVKKLAQTGAAGNH